MMRGERRHGVDGGGSRRIARHGGSMPEASVLRAQRVSARMRAGQQWRSGRMRVTAARPRAREEGMRRMLRGSGDMPLRVTLLPCYVASAGNERRIAVAGSRGGNTAPVGKRHEASVCVTSRHFIAIVRHATMVVVIEWFSKIYCTAHAGLFMPASKRCRARRYHYCWRVNEREHGDGGLYGRRWWRERRLLATKRRGERRGEIR